MFYYVSAEGKTIGLISTHTDDHVQAGDVEFEKEIIGPLYETLEMDNIRETSFKHADQEMRTSAEKEDRIITTNSGDSNALEPTSHQTNQLTPPINMIGKDRSVLKRSSSTDSKTDESMKTSLTHGEKRDERRETGSRSDEERCDGAGTDTEDRIEYTETFRINRPWGWESYEKKVILWKYAGEGHDQSKSDSRLELMANFSSDLDEDNSTSWTHCGPILSQFSELQEQPK
jgi:hypothetical protein